MMVATRDATTHIRAAAARLMARAFKVEIEVELKNPAATNFRRRQNTELNTGEEADRNEENGDDYDQ